MVEIEGSDRRYVCSNLFIRPCLQRYTNEFSTLLYVSGYLLKEVCGGRSSPQKSLPERDFIRDQQ